MLPKPRYLDLDNELYSPITLHKELIIDNPHDHFHLQLFEQLTYDSYDRIIDLTQPINHVLRKTYGPSKELQVFVYDPYLSDYRFLAYFPQENNIILGEQFLQSDSLLFRINPLHEQNSSDQEQLQLAGIDCDDVQEDHNQPAGPQQKVKRRKTIKEMLQVIEQWRKLNIQYNYKLSLSEGAEMVGISKRTLEFYIQTVKMAQKYGYPFQLNLQKKITELKTFLKQKKPDKKNQEMELLSKMKHFYK